MTISYLPFSIKAYVYKYYKINVVLMVLFIFSTPHSFGNGEDTNYVKLNNRKFIVRGWLDYKVISLNMTPLNIGSMVEKSIIYIPNVSTSIGLALSYKYFAFSYSFKIPYLYRDAEKYGNSTYRDMKFSYIKRKFIVSGIFKQYKGFYIENTTSLFTSWFEDNPRPQRLDIEYMYLGLEGFWVFNNKKFSSDAYFNQKDLQYKNAFSLLAMGDLGITQLKGDTFLIPKETGYTGELSEMKKFNYYSIDASIGATYSFIIKHRVYIAPILFAGFGVQIKDYDRPGDDLLKTKLIYRINFRLSMGYNSKSFFGGIFVETENMIMPEKEILVMSNALAINGFLGVKFLGFGRKSKTPK